MSSTLTKQNKPKLTKAASEYLRAIGSRGGAAGTGAAKKRGTRKFYQAIGKLGAQTRKNTDWAANAKKGWATRRANAKRAAKRLGSGNAQPVETGNIRS